MSTRLWELALFCVEVFMCIFIPHSCSHILTGGETGVGGICPVGFYCPQGTTHPIPCGAGSYSSVSGLDACLPCPAGYYCLQGKSWKQQWTSLFTQKSEVLRTILMYFSWLYISENIYIFFSSSVKYFHTWPVYSIYKVSPVACVILLLCMVQLNFRSSSNLFKTFLFSEYFS